MSVTRLHPVNPQPTDMPHKAIAEYDHRAELRRTYIDMGYSWIEADEAAGREVARLTEKSQ